jgi:hypothetical protein
VTAAPAPEGQGNEALVEKMMMNLRRASLNFGRLDGAEGEKQPGDDGKEGEGQG